MEPACQPIAVYCPEQGTLESAMNMLVDVFQSHALQDGDKFHLNRWEMKDLFQRELRQLLESSKDIQKSCQIIDDLDKNRDGKVDFEEFVSVATKLIMCCHSYFREENLMCGYR
ncbi:hypothetical protein ABVT39_017590 [Epinephelus coioides]